MRRFGMATVMVTVLLAGSPSQAETNTQTKRYIGSTVVVAAFINSGNPDVGGIASAKFVGEGTPISVSIDDEVTHRRVAFWASQDFDGDNNYGEEGEPSQHGCAEPGLPTALDRTVVPFVSAPIGVFVHSIGGSALINHDLEALIYCNDGQGVRGSITLTRTMG